MAIEVGNIIDGTVSGITKFGVFVDLGEKQTGLSIRQTQPKEGMDEEKRPHRVQSKQSIESFEAKMKSFLRDSNERLHDLKRNTEGKRGGRGGRRD